MRGDLVAYSKPFGFSKSQVLGWVSKLGMASSSQKNRSAGRRVPSSQSAKGFWRALVLSTLASFGALSYSLKLPWLTHVEQYIPEMAALQEPVQWLSQLLMSAPQGPVADILPGQANTTDFAQCRHLFPHNLPPVVQALSGPSYALCFDAFAILYNADTKTPVYVVERINRAGLLAAKSIKRTDRFYPEARLPSSARAQLDDYRGSGYARGHMAPAGNMPNNEAMAQSFSLANMVPQNQSQNSGPWNKIESDTRQYAMRAQGDVFVFTGPAYTSASPLRIGDSKVAVPSHLFKLVYDPATQRAWAHWQQNQAGKQSLKPISYSELSQRMQIDFLPHRVNTAGLSQWAE